jgi:hypothetical protein
MLFELEDAYAWKLTFTMLNAPTAPVSGRYCILDATEPALDAETLYELRKVRSLSVRGNGVAIYPALFLRASHPHLCNTRVVFLNKKGTIALKLKLLKLHTQAPNSRIQTLAHVPRPLALPAPGAVSAPSIFQCMSAPSSTELKPSSTPPTFSAVRDVPSIPPAWPPPPLQVPHDLHQDFNETIYISHMLIYVCAAFG